MLKTEFKTQIKILTSFCIIRHTRKKYRFRLLFVQKKKENELLTIVAYARLLNDMYMYNCKAVTNAYRYGRVRVGVICTNRYLFFIFHGMG